MIITDSKATELIRSRSKIKGSKVISMEKEMNIEMEIMRTIAQSEMQQPNIEWVKAHTDIEEAENLYYATLNSMADDLATEARNKVLNEGMAPVIHSMFPGTIAALKVGKHLIHNNMKKIIKKHCHYEELKYYLKKKHTWSEQVYGMINWEAIGWAMKSYQPCSKPGIVKYIHGWQHNNRQKWKFSKENDNSKMRICPHCEEEETSEHILECNGQGICKARRQGWKVLREKMKPYTSPLILDKIWLGLHSIENNHAPDFGPCYDEETETIRGTFEEQSKIGWTKFFLGFIATEWGVLNNKLNRDVKIDPVAWTAKLVREVWNFGLGLWAERNNTVHGNKWTTSIEDKSKIMEKIKLLFEVVKPVVLEEDKWLFNKEEKLKKKEPFPAQVAWVEQVETRYEEYLQTHELYPRSEKVSAICPEYRFIGHNFL